MNKDLLKCIDNCGNSKYNMSNFMAIFALADCLALTIHSSYKMNYKSYYVILDQWYKSVHIIKSHKNTVCMWVLVIDCLFKPISWSWQGIWKSHVPSEPHWSRNFEMNEWIKKTYKLNFSDALQIGERTIVIVCLFCTHFVELVMPCKHARMLLPKIRSQLQVIDQ